MCGRFTLTRQDITAVAAYFDAEPDVRWIKRYRPRYNIAPTDEHWLLTPAGSKRVLSLGRWGVARPTRGGSGGGGLQINARSEGIAGSPHLRAALRSGRCGVVADGFFEWTGPKNDRRPLWFHRPDRRMFAFAGLCIPEPGNGGGSGGSEPEVRFTILTTAADETVSPYHHRMPVVLQEDAVDPWLRADLGRNREEIESALATLLAPPPDPFEATFVSKRVNRPQNDDPMCLEPTPDARQVPLIDP